MHLVHATAAEPALLSPDWWSAFTRSAGFGGVTAVVAAFVALLTGSRRNATDRGLERARRAAHTTDQSAERWWSMYRWLLEQPGRLLPDHAAVLLHALARQAPTTAERQLVAAASVLFASRPESPSGAQDQTGGVPR